MAEMTNEQIAKRLQRILMNASDAGVRPSIESLADELQPKPEFKLGTWVVIGSGEIAQVTGPAPTGDDLARLQTLRGYWIDRPWEHLRPFRGDPLDILQQHIDGKLISTDGLPELPEGWEYTGEYREPGIDEYYDEYYYDLSVRRPDKRIVGSWTIGPRLIVRRKDAAND